MTYSFIHFIQQQRAKKYNIIQYVHTFIIAYTHHTYTHIHTLSQHRCWEQH